MVFGNQDAAIKRNFYPRKESSQYDVNFHFQPNMGQDYWDQVTRITHVNDDNHIWNGHSIHHDDHLEDQIYHASDMNTIDHGDDDHNNWSGHLFPHEHLDHLPEDQIYHGTDLNTIDHGNDDHNNWRGHLIHHRLTVNSFSEYCTKQ